MIVQVEQVLEIYEGMCRPFIPEYRWWYKFLATNGVEYNLVSFEGQQIHEGQLLNIKPYPKSWIRKYKKSWGLVFRGNYVKLI